LIERNKKTPPRQKEALYDNKPSFLLLSNLGSNAVFSNAVDPDTDRDTDYLPCPPAADLGEIAPENLPLSYHEFYDSVKEM
jgi:hypothetical protein